MPTTRTKTIIGVGAVLVLLILAGALFVRYQIHASFPVTEGSLRVQGINARVQIIRDEYGVPRILAECEEDLAFGQGFVHAQDRLWQMDMQRRVAAGRLSELLGKETVPFDRMFRVVGLRRTAERIAGSLPAKTRAVLESYAAGVNAFLAQSKGKYPIEFDLLRYDPEPWSLTDCLLIGRLMAWELNLAWWTDLTLGAIGEKVGPQELLDILPPYPADVPPTVPGTKGKGFASLTEGMRRTGYAFLHFTGAASFGTGSNAWVVGPAKSVTGKVLLANDTHLQLTVPPQWYEVQLRCPGYNAGGMSVPGAPWIVAGRNDSIAWGITSAMADEADFYVEQLDSATGMKAWFDGTWNPLTIRTEEIVVRGDSNMPVVVRETVHGPIVTDITTPLQSAHPSYVASMHWTGAEVDDQFSAFRLMGRAGNWEEFSEGVRLFAVPGQNFIYGDGRGNIGYRCGARIPIRGKQNPMLPFPGWERSSLWKGFVPFEELPHLYNPPEGFIASTNNKIADKNFPYYISDLWEPPSRIQRLREVLGRDGEAFSVQDFQRLQNDTYSYAAREITPYIFAAFADSTRWEEGEKVLLEYLRNWNFYFTRDDIATSIFQMFLVRLLENTYKDEMGEELFHDWLILVNVPIRVTTRLLQEGTSLWFDDRTTPDRIETRDDIIRKSLREAGEELQRRRGPDRKQWQWGELHTVTLNHPFGLRKPLDRIFNLGPYTIGGASTSLTSFEYSFNEPFAVTVGPSYRQIFDMANDQEVRAILPSGQSGQIFRRHYDDQTRLWLNGGYRVERRDGGGARHEALSLEPER
jgi:penicillin amidase